MLGTKAFRSQWIRRRPRSISELPQVHLPHVVVGHRFIDRIQVPAGTIIYISATCHFYPWRWQQGTKVFGTDRRSIYRNEGLVLVAMSPRDDTSPSRSVKLPRKYGVGADDVGMTGEWFDVNGSDCATLFPIPQFEFESQTFFFIK